MVNVMTDDYLTQDTTLTEEALIERKTCVPVADNKRPRRRRMEIVWVCVGVAVAGGAFVTGKFLYDKKQKKNQKSQNKATYTEQDKDLLKLVNDLATIYSKTEDYLKK